MSALKKPVRFLLIFSACVLLFVLAMQPLAVIQFQNYIAFLFPSGWVAREQRDLFLITQVIMLLVVIPVYILTFIFSWRYRAYNNKATYDPDLTDNLGAEVIWWGIPLVLTTIICILTWFKTHELDPYKPLASEKKPITVQVVALNWKWLFLYPEEKIATINFLKIPVDVPVRFEITADAPMNSFWIPKLGGQIYAMPGCKTELNLIANSPGEFRGSSANLSGKGFAGMTFTTHASSEEEYRKWIGETKKSNRELNFEQYEKIAQPSEYNPPEYFQLKDINLFEQVLNKFMPEHKGH